ncbi:MerR family transcriptional regulator [Amycolatopsis sp. NPDC051071]|uniref:MerR family transcriptional regulator n=1 Tax=Amycolatopsis sp. NPDC051071 TaxID=3154637 RepID=UPI003414CCC1
MKIGELAQKAGVSVRALRYYEEEGLISSGREGNGYRDFCDGSVEAVLRIRGMLDAGLPTRLIREILPYLDGPEDVRPKVRCEYLIDEVARQREALDRRIVLMTRNRDALDVYLRDLTLTQT